MVSLPPEGMASRALTARFMMTCSICPASARTGQRFWPGTMHEVDVLADHAGEHLQVLGGDVVQVDDARGEHLLAAEGEQLAGQRGGAFGGAGDLLGRTAQMRLGAEALEQEFRVAGDHHEQIVEVVGDAAGEAADRFHLLRLAQLLLEGAAFGDVFGEESRRRCLLCGR